MTGYEYFCVCITWLGLGLGLSWEARELVGPRAKN